MKILVTGGAGFIGSHVVDAYLDAGHDVAVVDNLSTGRRVNLNPDVRFYEMDIRNRELAQVFAVEQPEVVNHHAAQIDVHRSVAEPLYDADVNIMGSILLLELCRASGVRQIIYSSSGGAVYGEPVCLPCDEDHPIRPTCQYGASKHTVEHYLHISQVSHGMRYAVLRYGKVYGPRQDSHGEAGVVAIFIGQMLAGAEVIINGDGEQSRDFINVKDCVKANVAALNSNISALTVNIGSGRPTSINEIFFELAALTGYWQSPAHGFEKLGETRDIYLKVDRAQRTLGWKPDCGLQDGLAETIDYFREALIGRR